jgi:hypothetical protein
MICTTLQILSGRSDDGVGHVWARREICTGKHEEGGH